MKKISVYIVALLTFLSFACNKGEFLDTKPDQALAVPKTLKDFQAILDKDLVMNGAGAQGLVPQLGETGSDNYYLPDATFTGLAQYHKNCYTWEKEINTGETVFDWNNVYRSVFYSNVVLDGLATLSVTADEQPAYDNVKGSALFYRAHCFYQLAQVFAPHYDATTAASDWGIPLRTSPTLDEKMQRATVQQTYDRIFTELLEARSLLPETPLYKTRPSKVSVYALLARIYQTIGDFDKALLYADSTLQIQSTLLDYNTLNPGAFTPVPRFNPEVIFACNMIYAGSPPISVGLAVIDTTLLNSYADDDLRKSIYYKNFGFYFFLGSYDESLSLFAGLATDEIYLIRAECYARKGNKDAAMTDLNTIMMNRWNNAVVYPAFTATDATDALNQILQERRKELVFRGLRWTDLRRLNKEGAGVTLTRIVNGQTYTLPPNDLRYTYSIPDQVLGFNPEMPQNSR